MNIEKLLGRIEDESYQVIHISDAKTEIHGIRFMTKSVTEPEGDILYYGEAALLPVCHRETDFYNYIVTDDGELPAEYETSEHYNLIRMCPQADVHAQYNRMQDYFVEDQKLTEKIRRLLAAFFANKGLQYIVDEAAQVLDNPVFVVDNNYKYIAEHVGEAKGQETSEFMKVIRQELSEQSVLEEGIRHINAVELDVLSSRGGDYPIYHYNEVFKAGTLIGTVRVRNVVVGHVMMVEEKHPFSDMDKDCFIRLVQFVSQEIQKIPFYRKNKGQMFSYFLVELLNDVQPNLHSIKRQLDTLHFELSDRHYVAVIGPEQGELTPKDAELLAEQFRGILMGNIYAAYKDALVILFNRKKKDALGEYTIETLAKYAQINGMRVGISNAFEDITGIHRYYEQAVKAVTYGKLIHPAEFIYHYENFAYMQLLDICRKEANMVSFCSPAVMKLMDYDEKNHTEFMKTLYYYLEHNGNTSLTAKALYIHKNTLLYRMDKIKGLIHNDLVSGETYFILHLSFRILIQMNLFDPMMEADRQNS